MVKNLPAIQETWLGSLGWKDPREKGMTTHSNILSWRIAWKEEPGQLQSVSLQRIVRDRSNSAQDGTAHSVIGIKHWANISFLCGLMGGALPWGWSQGNKVLEGSDIQGFQGRANLWNPASWWEAGRGGKVTR